MSHNTGTTTQGAPINGIRAASASGVASPRPGAPLSPAPCPPLPAPRQYGFTLIEMVAVLALIAIIAVAMSVSLVRGLNSTKVKAASRELAAAMRYTRGQAIIRREERALEVDVESKSYTAPGKRTVKLPDDMHLRLLTGRQELSNVAETAGRIRFFPDGSSTGGRVRLSSGPREWVVNVAWLTGEISLEEAQP